MRRLKKFDFGFIIISFIFAAWFFGKSLGYDTHANSIWVARNQVGDFGLHLSLVRSFSWGDNFPPQSPFYPGIPLSYHYLFDLLAGMIARMGVRIDIAINGLSIIALVVLLYGIYLLSQRVFGKNLRVGMLSVLLFLSPGGWSFLDFFRTGGPSTWVQRWWRLPDFIHSGPFDGSIYSTYFTLNVLLNQRHLVAAMAMGLLCLSYMYPKLVSGKQFRSKMLVLCGIWLGLMFWMHSLVCIGMVIILGCMLVSFRRWKDALIMCICAGLIALPRVWVVMNVAGSHTWWNPGFIAPKSAGFYSWFLYWWSNLGLSLFLIPIGVWVSTRRERLLWWSAAPLFIAANIFQFSFRIEHNHSLLNFFFLIVHIYGAFALDRLWRMQTAGKVFVCSAVLIISLNGLMQFTAIKNDFHFPVPSIQSDPLMAWIVKNTAKQSIFVSTMSLMNPVTLSGRYTYVGPSYYLDVMGYNASSRLSEVKAYLEEPDDTLIRQMEKNGIGYILVPRLIKSDYPYTVDNDYFASHTSLVYSDSRYFVYKL